jgi:hypothetical protein
VLPISVATWNFLFIYVSNIEISKFVFDDRVATTTTGIETATICVFCRHRSDERVN